ncbi:hypothetical protein ACGFYP_09620 [Streptomyces sp. NPDC048370]|uniref:hypothetical protein n=1 Tax=Streptomyces sp. NPDC048370 TaxID=3365540 RepID=UPI00371C7BEF
MRVTRRTIRTAAIATGTIAALTLPAAGAFAAESPAADRQVTQEDQSVGDQGDQGDQDRGTGDQDRGTGDQQVVPDKGDQDNQGDPQKQTDPPVERAFIKSFKLADGSVAKVYQTGTDEYVAEIWAGGSLIDTLTTTGSPAYGQNNGLHVVLQPDGSVTSWVEGNPTPKPTPTPKPKPKPTPDKQGDKKVEKKKAAKKASSVTITMPDGRLAKLVKSPGGPRVVISMPNGHHLGTLDLKNPTATNDGWTYKIAVAGKGQYKFVVIDTPKQGGNSWVYDFHGKLIEKYQVQKGKTGTKTATTVVVPKGTVPKGGVKAGAENVSDTSDQAALIGAGGGLAALGAAGLGFALYHRRAQR